MWSKPSELTNYTGNVYEIAYESSDKARGGVNSWKLSNGFNDLILNQKHLKFLYLNH